MKISNNQTIEAFTKEVERSFRLLFTEGVHGDLGFYELASKYNTEVRIRFIEYCLENKYSLSQTAKIVNLSKGYTYRLYRYGSTGRLCKGERKEILERDNFKCVLCKNTKNLHIHHKGNPRSRKSNNLVTLCASCHKKYEGKKIEKI